MFLYEGFFYLFFNMLMFYWFGCIVGDLFGDYCILLLYLLVGLVGNVVYFIIVNFILFYVLGSIVYGVSGVVMGIVLVVVVLVLEMEMWLLLLGNVKLKYIVVGLLLIDIIGVGGMNNMGGYFVYLGGVVFGWFFI